ncbi:MAG: calcium-binding protein [Selenomonadaceae bacterium]|nr:calcium-binding protein [Selenomonadaceae bacterium]
MAVIYNSSSNTLISGTSGHDSIFNKSPGLGYKYEGNNVTIETYKGSDTIENYYGDSVSIDTGTDNDYVLNNNGNNITIISGKGNDTVYNYGCYTSGYREGYHGSSISIYSGTGDDYIANEGGSSVTIDAGAGNDTINSRNSNNVTINTGAGNNFVSVYGGSNIEIIGSTGKDTAYNYASNVTIDTGAGNDSIYAEGTNITVIGGTGNDSIKSNGTNVLFKYTEGDGNDRIEGISMTDTLQIGGGKGTYSSQASGEDIIITVGDGKITLVGAVGKSVYIECKKSSASKNTWKLNGTTATYGTSGKTLVTVKGVKSIDGLSLNDKVVMVAKSSLGTSKITISNGYTLKLADDVDKTSKTTNSWSYGNSTATYKQKNTAYYSLASNKKSISFNKATNKTLATINGVKSASGLSISGKVIKVPNSIVGASKNVTLNNNGNDYQFVTSVSKATLKGGNANDTVKIAGNNTTINAGKGNDLVSLSSAAKNNVIVYKNGDGSDTINGFDENDTLKITSGTAKVTTSGSDVIFTVGSGKITITGGKNKEFKYIDAGGEHIYKKNSGDEKIITLTDDYDEEIYTMGSKLRTVDASAVELDLKIIGNKYMNKIDGGAGNDTLIGGKSNDTITGRGGADVFVYSEGDGNDIITDYEEEDFISIASGAASFKVEGQDIIVTVGTGTKKGTITLKNAADKVISYIEDDEEKTFGDTTSDVEVKGKTVTISENYTDDSFDLSGYAKTIKTINASAVTRDLKIMANSNANSIIGGAGNDILIGDKGNDTLKGGNGSDTFLYNSGDGDDVIIDYADEDKIKIASGTIKSVKQSGNDVVLTVGSNKIMVKGAADKTVTYIDAENETNYFPMTPTNPVILTGTSAILRETYSEDDFTAKNYGDAIETIDASAVTRKLKITGNGKANLILGGYENDTITGGKGADTLQGGSGADIFVYKDGDGKDLIVDYAEEDKIQITSGKVKNSSISGNDVIFTVGSGKITVQNAANKSVNLIDKNGNNITYSMLFLADDDNFETKNELSAIIQSDSADYSFLNTSTTLVKENNLIAYGGKK